MVDGMEVGQSRGAWSHVGRCWSISRVQGEDTDDNRYHDSLHLFNCPDIPTTLTVWDLWTDPVGVAALLDVWGEKLSGPRAGV